MCGRFAQDDDTNAMIEEYVRAGGRPQDWVRAFHDAWDQGKGGPLEVTLPPAESDTVAAVVVDVDERPNYNLAPTDHAVIVRDRDREDTGTVRHLEVAQWGFWPSYIKPGDRRPRPINARVETIGTNGMFRSSYLERRCIVPMLGYYEWKPLEEHGKTVKQPYFIHQPDRHYLSAAGLWTVRKDEAGEWAVSFTIVTREARDASGEIHDRMPVFLSAELREDWLHPGKLEDPDGMLERIRDDSGSIAAAIATYPVSRRVNNVRTAEPTDASLIEAVDEA